jgi:hypothetical protein
VSAHSAAVGEFEHASAEGAPGIAASAIGSVNVAPDGANVIGAGAERAVCIPVLAAGVALCVAGVVGSPPRSPAVSPGIAAPPATSPILPPAITASSPGVVPLAPTIAASSPEVADLVDEVTRRAPLCADLGAQDSAVSPSVGPFGA